MHSTRTCASRNREQKQAMRHEETQNTYENEISNIKHIYIYI